MKNVSADCIELSLSPLSDIFATQSEYRRQKTTHCAPHIRCFITISICYLRSWFRSLFVTPSFFAIVVTCPNPSIWAYHLPKDHNYHYRSLSEPRFLHGCNWKWCEKRIVGNKISFIFMCCTSTLSPLLQSNIPDSRISLDLVQSEPSWLTICSCIDNWPLALSTKFTLLGDGTTFASYGPINSFHPFFVFTRNYNHLFIITQKYVVS